MMRAARHLVLTAGWLGLAASAAADGGGSLVVGAPRGALARAADVAGGLAGYWLWPASSSALSLRLDGSWLIYGSETIREPLAVGAGRIVREVTTDNWMAQAGVGPQLVLPRGPVRPYVHAFVGATYLSTSSYLTSPAGFVTAESTNFDDTAFSYGGGGGFIVPLRSRGMSIDVGVRYVRTPSARFLAEGDLGRGGAPVPPRGRQGDADVIEMRLGLAFGSRLR